MSLMTILHRLGSRLEITNFFENDIKFGRGNVPLNFNNV